MQKKTLAIVLALVATLATAAAVVYVVDSNTLHVTWTLTCGTGNVCVLFQNLGGNATAVNYSIKVIANQALSNQYLNTTVAAGPPNVVYNLNGTTGTRWLFGPYSFAPNVYYPFAFLLKYNGTAGSYDFAVNVLQAQ